MFAAIGQVAFKLGAIGRESILDVVNGRVVLGLWCYGIGTAVWVFAFSKARLTVVYPFTALTFVLVTQGQLCVLTRWPPDWSFPIRSSISTLRTRC
jgi:hypothetical protein